MALPGYTDPITKKALEGLQAYEVKASKPNNTYNLSSLGNSGNIDPTKNQNIISPPTSDIQTQIAGLMSQVTQMQKQVDEAKKVGVGVGQTQANETPTVEAPKEESVWDKLMGRQKEREAQIQAMPTADELVNTTLSKWGLTPESYQGMNNIAAQIGEVNKQIATLEQQEMEAINTVQTRPGQTIDWTTGETNRISREYAIKKSGLAGTAAALGTQLSALQGNWKTAQSMAETAINASLTAQKQKVDDLQWADEFYADIIQAMDKSDQENWKTMLQYEQDTYKAQEAQSKAVRDIVLGNPNAFSGMNWTTLTPDEAAMISANNPKQPTIDPTLAAIRDITLSNAKELQEVGQPITGAGALGDAFTRALGGTAFTNQDRMMYRRQFQNYINSGDTASAISFVKDIAISGMGTEAYKQFVNRESAIVNLQNVKSALDSYIANGGKTNILVGTYENVLNKLGATQNPKLATLAAQMRNSLVEFRRAATGVQFSMQEQKQYEQLFPNIGKNVNLNAALISGLTDIMNNTNNTTLRQRVGDAGFNALVGGRTSGTTSSGNVQVGSIIEYNGKRYKVGAGGEMIAQ